MEGRARPRYLRLRGGQRTRQRISPCGTRNQPSSSAAQARQPSAIRSRSSRSRVPAAGRDGREGRLDRAVSPEAAPPCPLGLGGVGPVGRGVGYIRQAGFPRPDVQAAATVRLAAVAPRDPLVERSPFVQDRELRVPGHAAEVGLADRHQPAGLGDPAHLAQRANRVAQVLEDLVRVDHVEGAVRVVEGVDVAGGEVGVRPVPGQFPSLLDDLLRGVDTGDMALRNAIGQVRRDRAGTAANVEDRRVRGQVRQQVRRRVLRRAPQVRPQHRLMMTVCVYVCHLAILETVLNDEQTCLIFWTSRGRGAPPRLPPPRGARPRSGPH